MFEVGGVGGDVGLRGNMVLYGSEGTLMEEFEGRERRLLE